MSALSPATVRHIAKLARLRLSDEEVTTFSTELSGILQYVDMLKEVDTTGVAATAQVTGLENVFRDDVIESAPVRSDDLLRTSALPIRDHQIVTPAAHG